MNREMDLFKEMEKAANKQKHLNNPFYKDADAFREKIVLGQIIKGSEKYPEPFTTASWTNKEIIVHAMQENVDQAHYIYAALERMEVLDKEIEGLEEENEALKDLSKAWEKKYKEAEQWAKDAEVSANEMAEESAVMIEQLQKEVEEWKKTANIHYEDARRWEDKVKQSKHDCHKHARVYWKENLINGIDHIVCTECNSILYRAK